MTPPESTAPRALVIDDMRLNRVLLERSLKVLGFQVKLAVDGEDGLRQLDEGGVDVVFLDWEMPGIGGDEVSAAIRGRPDAPPIVAITAEVSDEMRERCRRAGVAVFLGKAFDLGSLRKALATLPNASRLSLADGALNGLAPAGASGGAEQALSVEISGGRWGLDALVHMVGRSPGHLAAERAKLARALADGRKEAAINSLSRMVLLSGMVGASRVQAATSRVRELLETGEPVDQALAELDARLASFRPVGAAPPPDSDSEGD